MRVLFVGSTALSEKILRKLVDLEGIEVVGCISALKHFSISYRPEGLENVLFSDLEPLCHRLDIPMYRMTHGPQDEGLLGFIATRGPDVILVIGWHHVVPKSWRHIAPAFGVHASLLPDLAGGAPLVWALILGREETGVTMFRLEDEMDAGGILLQRRIAIGDQDTIRDLLGRVEVATVAMVPIALDRMASRQVRLLPQDLGRRVVMPQRSPEDGRIDWGWSAAHIDRFVRAQTKPYPGAFTETTHHTIRIWEGFPVHGAHPGPESLPAGTPHFRCADGVYVPTSVSLDGRDMSLSDLAESVRGGSTVWDSG